VRKNRVNLMRRPAPEGEARYAVLIGTTPIGEVWRVSRAWYARHGTTHLSTYGSFDLTREGAVQRVLTEENNRG
jgi:hypothetical protein